VKRFIVEMDNIAYITILATIAIMLMAIFRFVVKYAFNVNVIKRNVVTPLVFSVLLFGILLFLIIMRGQ
jgi:hypothetical protein